MAYKVLVVDDSSFFQVRLKEIINEHPDLEVVGIAANGREAIDMAARLEPDIISMDYEMPYLDGVSAIKEILAARTVPIVMFSSLTYEGAKTTLDALAAGAVDFIPKNFAEVSKNSAGLKKKLHDTLITFARKASAESVLAQMRAKNATSVRSVTQPEPAPSATLKSRPAAGPAKPAKPAVQKSLAGKIDAVIIGCSTGGPVALTEVLTKLPANYKLPILVVQHMPENFTKALAERLDKQCKVSVSEAKDGDSLNPGHVLIAPGGHQCIFDRRGKIKIMDADDRVTYKPSVDVTFASAASIFSARVLGIVLTGMGSDGCEGARLLKQKQAHIWAQDQASCVVYGMPKAVTQAGLADEVFPLGEMGERIVSALQ